MVIDVLAVELGYCLASGPGAWPLNPVVVPEKDNGCASDSWVGLCVMIATCTPKAVITSCDGLTVTIKPRRCQHNTNDAKFNAAERALRHL
jgi:hypothetical protein